MHARRSADDVGRTATRTRRDALTAVTGVAAIATAGRLDAVDGTAASDGSGTPDRPSQTIRVAVDEPSAEATVSMVDDRGNRFDPQLVWIAGGGRIVWRNDDPEHDHDAASLSGRIPEGAASWSTGLLQPGETYCRTFTEPGVYDYVCTPHASRMVGRVVVGRPDPDDERTLSADSEPAEGDEARAALVELNERTGGLLASGERNGNERDCDCPD